MSGNVQENKRSMMYEGKGGKGSNTIKHKERRKFGRRRAGTLTLLERWAIADRKGWGPRPLSPKHLERQAANRLPTDSVEHLREWLLRRGWPVDQFRATPLYTILVAKHPHLKDL